LFEHAARLGRFAFELSQEPFSHRHAVASNRRQFTTPCGESSECHIHRRGCSRAVAN
jgi:hypothetical protein